MRSLLDRLEQALNEQRGCVVFDADGTLWSGDVGEDVFIYCTREMLLREEAADPLSRLADVFGIQSSSNPSTQGQLLWEAFTAGLLPEREACEMMAWGFAGYTHAELLELCTLVLEQAALEQRRFEPMTQIMDWARSNGLQTLVVSASPSFVVEAATAPLGFTRPQIAGCEPAAQAGRLLGRLEHPLPYAEQKVHAAARLSGDQPILAAFGDNTFDMQLLDAARVAVAVRPKPAMRQMLHERGDVILLD